MSGGRPVQLEGTDLPVWGMEIDPDEAKERFRASSAKDGGKVGSLTLHAHSAMLVTACIGL